MKFLQKINTNQSDSSTLEQTLNIFNTPPPNYSQRKLL
ncbi:unnamed protein product, partial [Adineta steineri]